MGVTNDSSSVSGFADLAGSGGAVVGDEGAVTACGAAGDATAGAAGGCAVAAAWTTGEDFSLCGSSLPQLVSNIAKAKGVAIFSTCRPTAKDLGLVIVLFSKTVKKNLCRMRVRVKRSL